MKEEAGFSLTELLIASLIMVMITGALSAGLDQTEVFYEDYSAEMDVRQQARVALRVMSTELRRGGVDMGNLEEVIPLAGDYALQMIGDIDAGDPDGPCGPDSEDADNGGAERVTYELDSGTLTLLRSVDCWNGSAWTAAIIDEVLARDVNPGPPVFRYFDATGTRIPAGGGTLDADTRDLVRSVEILLDLMDEDAESLLGDGQTNLTLRRRIALKNRERMEDLW